MPSSGPCCGILPASKTLSPDTAFIIGGGPHTRTIDFGAPGFGRNGLSIVGDTRPTPPSHFFGASVSVRYIWKLGYSFCSSHSSEAMRISLRLLLAYTRSIFVLSFSLPRTARMTWYIGVMPVPPATMPMWSNLPGAYSNLTKGPFMSSVSPGRIWNRCVPILDLAYRFTTSSKWPLAPLTDVGVYGRTTSLPSASVNLHTMQLAMGRWNSCCGSSSAKMNRRVSWLSKRELIRRNDVNSFGLNGDSGFAAAHSTAGCGEAVAVLAKGLKPAKLHMPPTAAAERTARTMSENKVRSAVRLARRLDVSSGEQKRRNPER
mmetsp:Transcript_16823/g.52236  ORF Transcript_16823/g.52236 Transcript_16823/m.52236 type:complete len:318 (-) Transcript_16823:79-1032(-)